MLSTGVAIDRFAYHGNVEDRVERGIQEFET